MKPASHYWAKACNYDGWRSHFLGWIGDVIAWWRNDPISHNGNPRRPF